MNLIILSSLFIYYLFLPYDFIKEVEDDEIVDIGDGCNFLARVFNNNLPLGLLPLLLIFILFYIFYGYFLP